MKMEKEIVGAVSIGRICPFIQKPPSINCYCVKLDSLSIEATIYYCGGNFLECEIYKSVFSKSKS